MGSLGFAQALCTSRQDEEDNCTDRGKEIEYCSWSLEDSARLGVSSRGSTAYIGLFLASRRADFLHCLPAS